jgi:hypothetical protein
MSIALLPMGGVSASTKTTLQKVREEPKSATFSILELTVMKSHAIKPKIL